MNEDKLSELKRLPTDGLRDYLVSIWNDLDFTSGDGGMKPEKLHRVTELQIASGILSFEIERHGAIVAGGSTNAEIQGWRIDLQTLKAEYGSRRKQIYKARVPWRAAEINAKAVEVAAIIRSGGKKPLLRDIIPEYDALPQQTKAGRAKRFNVALSAALNEAAALS